MSIIEQPKPKQRIILQEEGRLQAECVKWYRNEWCKNPKNLFSVFNEGLNMSTKLSLGMVGGVSDLIYYEPNSRKLIGIEMKFKGKFHDVKHLIRQSEWMIDVCDQGWFCDSLEMFKGIIDGTGVGIDPEKILKDLKNTKSKTIIWQ